MATPELSAEERARFDDYMPCFAGSDPHRPEPHDWHFSELTQRERRERGAVVAYGPITAVYACARAGCGARREKIVDTV